MKKNVVLFVFVGIVSAMVYAYSGGAAAVGGVDGTGASGGGGCGGCHSSTTSIGTKVELDSAGVSVTSYHPGTAYTIKVSATNNTGSTLPKFGFQLTAVKAVGAGTNPVNVGTWGTSLPTNVQNTSPSTSGLTETIIEHSTQITATSGTGSNGTTYVESIPWTAPVAGTGSVVLFGIINAVNNNGSNSGDHYQQASQVTITEATNVVLVASVHIAVTSGTNPTCTGSSVTFTATPTNGGTSPTYQWKVNGANVGTGGTTYTSTTLTNGQVVTCVMTSNLSGVTGSPATSNSITMTINAAVTPSVSIVASSSIICSGTNVTFTATPVNGGTSPTYQWLKNGSNISGATSSTYSSSALANGDVISVSMTSNAQCASPTSATSNTVTMTVNPAVTPSVSIVSSAGNTICPGQSVTFTATPVNGGTPGYQWKKNGVNITGATSSTYSTTSLVNGDVISVDMTSSASCATPSSVASNTITMTVSAGVTPSVTISSNVGTSICAGQSVTLTAVPVNGGNTPTYQWEKNGSNISGATGSTYTTNSLANGDVITVVLTSNATCATTTTATSNSLSFTIVTNAVPSVSIVSNVGDSICAGQSVTFTATPVNGGTTPLYQWKKNGSNITNATQSTYSSASLVNGDVITVQMTSNSQCVSTSQATSNAITITVVGSVVPGVSITSSTGTNACSGQNVTFTATPVNGGSTPVYQWMENGANIAGATSSTYSSSSLANGDVIDVVMTSGSTCASPGTATSNSITMTISSSGVAQVSIASNVGTSVCLGQSVTFTATPINGGTQPAYQWIKNGVNINSATNSVFTTSSLQNGDVITLQMTSNSPCVSQTQVVSNSIVMSIMSGGAPQISISSVTGLDVCQGASLSFTATPYFGGSAPNYQWSRNGIPVGMDSSGYSDNALSDGDVISCSVTSSLSCAVPSTAVSNSLTVTVYALPIATISASNDTLIASTALSYQWYRNNILVTGATGQTLVPTLSGTYRVFVTDAHGCQNMSSPFVFTGIAASPLANLKVYPNPSSGLVNLDLSAIAGEKINVRVIATDGRVITEKANIEDQKTELDLSAVQDGLYLLQISQGSSVIYRKIIINR
jgi:hypothetical protein